MFGTYDGYPQFNTYRDAEMYFLETQPIKGSGTNAGYVPIRENRTQARDYHIKQIRHEHPVNGDMVNSYAIYMYDTAIILYYEDGTIEIDEYDSHTTNKVQNCILPHWCHVASGKHLAIAPTFRAPMHDALSQVSSFYIPFCDKPISLVPYGKRRDRFMPYNYGYYIGIGYAFHDPLVRKLLRQALRQLKAFANMSGRAENKSDTLENVYPTKSIPHSARSSLQGGYEYLRGMIERFGWSPGDDISYDLMVNIAPYWGGKGYASRILGWNAVLKQEVKLPPFKSRPIRIASLAEVENLEKQITNVRESA